MGQVGQRRVSVGEPMAVLAQALAVIGGQEDYRLSSARMRGDSVDQPSNPGVGVEHFFGVEALVIARQREPIDGLVGRDAAVTRVARENRKRRLICVRIGAKP